LCPIVPDTTWPVISTDRASFMDTILHFIQADLSHV
jgi:hypothetical protein